MFCATTSTVDLLQTCHCSVGRCLWLPHVHMPAYPHQSLSIQAQTNVYTCRDPRHIHNLPWPSAAICMTSLLANVMNVIPCTYYCLRTNSQTPICASTETCHFTGIHKQTDPHNKSLATCTYKSIEPFGAPVHSYPAQKRPCPTPTHKHKHCHTPTHKHTRQCTHLSTHTNHTHTHTHTQWHLHRPSFVHTHGKYPMSIFIQIHALLHAHRHAHEWILAHACTCFHFPYMHLHKPVCMRPHVQFCVCASLAINRQAYPHPPWSLVPLGKASQYYSWRNGIIDCWSLPQGSIRCSGGLVFVGETGGRLGRQLVGNWPMRGQGMG